MLMDQRVDTAQVSEDFFEKGSHFANDHVHPCLVNNCSPLICGSAITFQPSQQNKERTPSSKVYPLMKWLLTLVCCLHSE